MPHSCRIAFSPPGWFGIQLVKSYTLPLMEDQQLERVLCVAMTFALMPLGVEVTTGAGDVVGEEGVVGVDWVSVELLDST